MEQFLVSQQLPKNKASDLKDVVDNAKTKKKHIRIWYTTHFCGSLQDYTLIN